MAYDEGVAERLREVFEGRNDIVEKKMFGGIAFMHSGNMCIGISDDALMARVGPDAYEQALQRPHAREMDFTGKPLRGFIYVDPPGFAEDTQLREWVALCEDFTGSLPPKQIHLLKDPRDVYYRRLSEPVDATNWLVVKLRA